MIDKERRRKGIICNCIKFNKFEWVKPVIMKRDRGIIRCTICGSKFQETEWELEDDS